MKRYWQLVACILFSSTLFQVQAADPAELSIYLFENGMPLPEASLTADGVSRGLTDINGYIQLSLPPGNHVLTFRQAENELLSLDLPVISGENAQVIVTTYTDGRAPVIDIQTSHPDGELATEDGLEEKKNLAKGVISGLIISAENKKPVAGARIFFSGIATELRSAQDGTFQTEVPTGDYSISIMHPNFSAQVRDGIEVAAETTREETFALTPAGIELPEHVVLEPHVAGSLAAIVEEQRSSSAVASVLGAEQISRSGDSDAAGALRRATGLTLVGGKFIFIRGLGERYSSTLLNGASIPSPDPTRRVVPLDLFPTSVIDSILIQKSYSVDRPAEFAGGTVEMRTKTIPDEFFFQLSGQMGITQGTTFEKGLRYKGGGLDMFGVDDGTRKMPASLAAATAGGRQLTPQSLTNPAGFTQEELRVLGNDLSGTFDINRKNIGPDHRINVAMGDRFRSGDFSFGYTTTIRWSNSWDTQNEIQRLFVPVGGNRLEKQVDNRVNITEREVNLNGYLGLEARYTDDHRLHANSLVLRQTLDEARITEGFTREEDFVVRRSLLQYIENSLILGQIGGEHRWSFLGNLETNWLWTRANAGRKAPYERSYRFDQIPNGGGAFFLSRRAGNNEINFADLNDDDESFRLDIKLPLELHRNLQLSLQSGFMNRTKSRDSEVRRFSFSPLGPDARRQDVLGLGSLEKILSPQFIGPNGFQLRESTQSTDNSAATQDLFAYYGQGDLNLFEKVRITGGLRVEDNDQQVKTFELFNPDRSPAIAKLVRKDVLPSVAATWSITDKQQIRASFAKTLSRPDFREFSSAPFIDPETDRITIGNPDLQQVDVKHYDVRWEYYFSPNESFSIGGFWKTLNNPIELILLPGAAGVLTLQNARVADVYGVEVELMKHLDFIHPKLRHVFVSTNYTWSKSEIELRPENLVVQTTNFRPLQGHSPYIFNFQLGYDDPDKGTMATLLYNTFGKRIAEVGSLGAPDKFDQPEHRVDFVFRQHFMKNFSFTFNARNILNNRARVLQGDELARSFLRGREFRMGLVLEF